VLQGLLFANLLAWEALGGRIAAWRVQLQAAALTDINLPMEQTHA
jgi:simple sugar transport system permease protein